MKIDPSIYHNRRKRFAERIMEGVAIIPAAPTATFSNDTKYPYRQDNYFYYLTGFPEDEAVLVVIAGNEPKSILFCKDQNHEKEAWTGKSYGPDGARDAFSIRETFSISKLDMLMKEILASERLLHYQYGIRDWDKRVLEWLGERNPMPHIRDSRWILNEMRLFKEDNELAIMKLAAECSAQAHIRAMQRCRPGMTEYELKAEVEHEFTRRGARPAYHTIVAGGINACTLHHTANDTILSFHKSVLIDAGCEYEMYASDITRTFPVGNTFSNAQKELYTILLEAQLSAIEKVRPGNTINDPKIAAVERITQGLIDVGILHGTREELMQSKAYSRFTHHRVSHWLGMDVHDVGDYRPGGKWRILAPNIVLTVEPGIYIPQYMEGVDERWWDIGMRIEDDVLVTKNGLPEVLTWRAPKTIEDMEAIRRA